MQQAREGTTVGDAIVGKFSLNQALTKVGVLFTEPDFAKRLFAYIPHFLVAEAAWKHVAQCSYEGLIKAH